MLGRALVRELQQRQGCTPLAWTRADMDVTNGVAVDDVITHAQPNVVINCAAYTDVNGAETHATEARSINAAGAENVARASAAVSARCFYVSTDYVFDGGRTEPYLEDDATAPLNAYGRTKLEGELRTAAAHPSGHAIFRTSWLYGHGARNFVDTMLRAGREGKDLKVVDDQTGSPTYVADLARLLADCAFLQPSGIYHATCQGACTWFGFAQEIFRQAGIEPRSLQGVPSSDFPTPAIRPANSRLANTHLAELGVQPLPYWQASLEEYLKSRDS